MKWCIFDFLIVLTVCFQGHHCALVMCANKFWTWSFVHFVPIEFLYHIFLYRILLFVSTLSAMPAVHTFLQFVWEFVTQFVTLRNLWLNSHVSVAFNLYCVWCRTGSGAVCFTFVVMPPSTEGSFCFLFKWILFWEIENFCLIGKNDWVSGKLFWEPSVIELLIISSVVIDG